MPDSRWERTSAQPDDSFKQSAATLCVRSCGRAETAEDAQPLKVSLHMPRYVKVLVAVLLWFAGVWLSGDSSTFALHHADPSTGRARGCYTAIEDALQLKQPSSWIRPAEQFAAAGLVLGLPLVVLSRAAKGAYLRRRNAR